jgi:hypothetical protein
MGDPFSDPLFRSSYTPEDSCLPKLDWDFGLSMYRLQRGRSVSPDFVRALFERIDVQHPTEDL